MHTNIVNALPRCTHTHTRHITPQLIPNAFYYERRGFDVKQICSFASNKKFTHLMVLGERAKKCNGMIVSRLPEGPTAYFKVSNVELGSSIAGHGNKTSHQPEIILNNFNTRLGRRVGRFLGSLFPHNPEFQGRQAVTFHNQRDFIFVRHHRYIFDEMAEEEAAKQAQKKQTASGSTHPGKQERVKARIQELGPRFTLKMKWLQLGSFDTLYGEYEWLYKRGEMDTSKLKFSL